MNSPLLPAPLFVTQLTNEGTSARLLGHFLALYCCLRFSSTPKERPAQTSCRTLLPPLPATLFRSTSSRYSSTRLETGSKSSRQHSGYCQHWQNGIAATATVAGFQRGGSVYKDVVHRQQKIFLPVPSGFRQKQQTLNQHDP